MARGDEALAGREEKNIPIHRFPPDDTKTRTICFKGRYLVIHNLQTDHEKTHEDNDIPTTEYVEYEIPPGYICDIRGASVYFKV